MLSFFGNAHASRRRFIDCDEIEPGLYLGNLEAAISEKTCKHLKITHILTAYHFSVNVPDNIRTLCFCVDDSEESDLLTLFSKSNKFIKEGQEAGACLVHCYAGISRSSTLVIAYLMNKYSISLETATFKVKQKRYQICPNSGFTEQLRLYEAMGCTLDESCIRYRIYLLQKLGKKIVTGNSFGDAASYAESAKSRTSGDKFKCKHCRQCLFSEENMIPHIQGGTLNWRNGQSYRESQICKSSFYVEVLPWFDQAFTNFRGRIYCPKCNEKLGGFNWTGQPCTCGAAICPCFRIVPSNVDREKDQNLHLKT